MNVRILQILFFFIILTPSLFHFTCADPGEPSIDFLRAEGNGMFLSWNISMALEMEVATYKLQLEEIDVSEGCSAQSQEYSTTNKSFNITELEGDSTYMITLTALTTNGSIITHNSVTVRTNERGKRKPLVVCHNNWNSSISPVPSAPPSLVTVTHVTSFSITVKWSKVNCGDRNGNITGYLLRYNEVGNNSQQTNATGADNYKFTIPNLMLATNYSIQVAAVNNAGTGIYSDVVFVKTIQHSEDCIYCVM